MSALKAHELPPPPPEAAGSDAEGTGNNLKRKADETGSSDDEEEHEPKRSKLDSQDDHVAEAQLQSTWLDMPEDDLLPPPSNFQTNFQKAKRNPGHPDFSLSFSTALELAFAKEKEEVSLAGALSHWAAVDCGDVEEAVEDAAENPAEKDAKASQNSGSSNEQRPKLVLKLTKRSETSTTSGPTLPTLSQPQQPVRAAPLLPRAGRPTRITKLHVSPPYDQDPFEAAVTMRESGLDFGDLRMVGWFNRAMWAEDRSRPGRSQKSLLRVSKMTLEEHTA